MQAWHLLDVSSFGESEVLWDRSSGKTVTLAPPASSFSLQSAGWPPAVGAAASAASKPRDRVRESEIKIEEVAKLPARPHPAGHPVK